MNMEKTSAIMCLTTAVCMLAASCQRDGASVIVREAEGAELAIVPTVSGFREMSTRGPLVNGEGTGNVPFDTGESFLVTAWDDASPAASFIPGPSGTAGSYQEVSWNGSEWKTAKRYYWTKHELKTFYAYANLPSDGASVTCANETGQTLSYAVPEAASDQTDILMGFYSGNSETGDPAAMTGTAGIVFSHPLAAVRFSLGEVKGVASFTVDCISIDGVYASGTAVMSATDAAKPDVEDRFVWTPTGSVTVSQSISTQPAAAGDPIGEAFLLIPQAFAGDSEARITVNCTVDGQSRTLYYPLASTGWKAGWAYTYAIDYNGHEGIQLWENGPYWATCNVGAGSPEDYGYYFAWDETTGYACRNIGTPQPGTEKYPCEFRTVPGNVQRAGGFDPESYQGQGSYLGGNIPVNPAHDAAQAAMGIKWRMPTEEEFQGLVDNTDMTYTTRNGVSGFLFKGNSTGYTNRSIFIPASGWGSGNYVSYRTKAVYLWSSSWDNTKEKAGILALGYDSNNSVEADKVNSSYRAVELDYVYKGYAVRAVENTEYAED